MKALNEHWPTNPGAYREREPQRVTARVVWEYGGEEYAWGRATKWDRQHVYVVLDEYGKGVWLKPADVYLHLEEPLSG